jgi:putative transcription factor
MPPCELCGKDAPLALARVEGSQLRVCAACGRYGQVLQQAGPPAPRGRPAPAPTAREAEVECLASDYGGRIRAARERRGLSQKDFARLIAEKESLVSKLEGGQFEPPLAMARKLERLLGIMLVERRPAGQAEMARPSKAASLTIGDVASIRSR